MITSQLSPPTASRPAQELAAARSVLIRSSCQKAASELESQQSITSLLYLSPEPPASSPSLNPGQRCR